MADKSTPLPTTSTTPLTLLKVSSGNPHPCRMGPEDILSNGFKLEVEQLMGDFMSQHDWTSTPKHGTSSSSPQTSLPPHNQPSTSDQPWIPTLTKFEKLIFAYLLKQGGPYGQSIVLEPPPPILLSRLCLMASHTHSAPFMSQPHFKLLPLTWSQNIGPSSI